MKKLIILDRDGVINHDSVDYIKSPQEWLPIAGSLQAITRLNSAGYQVMVASNQSGIAKKRLSIATLLDIHNKMRRLVEEAGGQIKAVFFCPHAPQDDCTCRKPKPGMYIDISKRSQVSLQGLPIIGDSLRDLQAAAAVNAQPYLVKTGNGMQTIHHLSESGLGDVPVFDDLAKAVEHIIQTTP